MIKGKYLFTSESVCAGHPDKVCDQISDSILDACLEQDPDARVAIEAVTKTGMVLVAGELTTKAYVNIPTIVRQTLREIGYTKSRYGIEYETCAVLVHIEEQSPDIAQGVDAARGHEQGAGDQGMMFGYATSETPSYMPLPIAMAHKLTARLAQVRKNKTIPYLGPDGKAQVTVEYENGRPRRITAVVVSNQHDDKIRHARIERDIIRHVVKPVCSKWLTPETKFYINPTGKFVAGGPYADAGLTGRKIIVDTYGGMARHGGGAFSGKDPSKVDRSAAYAMRWVAKNVVAAGLAERCEVQVAYAIGRAHPVGFYTECFGTETVPVSQITDAVLATFDLRPAAIIRDLDLIRPIYSQVTNYGHFGRELDVMNWERVDRAEALAKAVKG